MRTANAIAVGSVTSCICAWPPKISSRLCVLVKGWREDYIPNRPPEGEDGSQEKEPQDAVPVPRDGGTMARTDGRESSGMTVAPSVYYDYISVFTSIL